MHAKVTHQLFLHSQTKQEQKLSKKIKDFAQNEAATHQGNFFSIGTI